MGCGLTGVTSGCCGHRKPGDPRASRHRTGGKGGVISNPERPGSSPQALISPTQDFRVFDSPPIYESLRNGLGTRDELIQSLKGSRNGAREPGMSESRTGALPATPLRHSLPLGLPWGLSSVTSLSPNSLGPWPLITTPPVALSSQLCIVLPRSHLWVFTFRPSLL